MDWNSSTLHITRGSILNLKLKKRKLVGILLTLLLGFSIFSPVTTANVAITGNDSLENVYIHGLWSNNNNDTTIIAPGQEEAYYKFTINAGDRIYASVSYRAEYEGMSVSLLNAAGIEINTTQIVYDIDTVIPFMAINCNGINTGQTFYLRINRGTVDPSKSMYISYSFKNRIKTGSRTFNFPGTTSNKGNKPFNIDGVDSSILILDLTNSLHIPQNAVVRSVSTSGTQSPSQGGVKHKIGLSKSRDFYTAIVANATSGSYNISLSNEIEAKQIWQFRYNATAGAASTMKNVKLYLNWEYDLANMGYKMFLP